MYLSCRMFKLINRYIGLVNVWRDPSFSPDFILCVCKCVDVFKPIHPVSKCVFRRMLVSMVKEKKNAIPSFVNTYYSSCTDKVKTIIIIMVFTSFNFHDPKIVIITVFYSTFSLSKWMLGMCCACDMVFISFLMGKPICSLWLWLWMAATALDLCVMTMCGEH